LATLDRGPWLRHVTDGAASVWGRLSGAGNLELRIGASSDIVAVASGTDFCGAATVTGLSPATKYEYTVWADGVQASGPHEFITLPVEGSPARFEFFQTADHHQKYAGASHYMKAQLDLHYAKPGADPIFWVHTGDYEYNPLSRDVAGLRTMYRLLRDPDRFSPNPGYGYKRDLHSAVPYYSVWDDWDSWGDNCSPDQMTAAERLAAWQAWREYHAGAPALPEVDSNHYHFVVADCLFMFIDERSARTANIGSQPPAAGYDPQDRISFGATQIAWIKATLTTHRDAAFKFIIVGGEWLDNTAHEIRIAACQRDSIGIFYRNERNEIILFLRDNPDIRKGMCFITGDDHVQKVALPESWRAQYDYTTGPIGDSVGDPFDAPVVAGDLGIPFVACGIQQSGTPGDQGGIDLPYRNPDVEAMRYYAPRPGGNGHQIASRWKIDTTQSPPTVSCEQMLVGRQLGPGGPGSPTPYAGTVTYRFAGDRDHVWFPPYVDPLVHVDDASPSSSYADDAAAPATSYADDATPATSYVDPAAPATGYADDTTPATTQTPDAGAPGADYVCDSELVPGGGFEDPADDANWTLFTGASIDTGGPYQGLRNLTLRSTYGAGPPKSGQAQRFFDGQIGATYRLKFALDGDAAMNNVVESRLKPSFKQDALLTLLETFDPDTIDAGYNEYSYDFTLTQGTAHSIYFDHDQSGSGFGVFSGYWYIDNVSLTMIRSPWADDPGGAAVWS